LEAERSFIADAAHELRTPIAAMRINVEALQQQNCGQASSNPRAQELLAGMLRSLERATRLVAQLLSLMRSESQLARAQPEVLALDELAQDRLALLSQAAELRGVELSLQSTPRLRVLGERERLTSMLDNLIDNAIKYSPKAGVVHLALEAAQGQICLMVQDQGPGIAADLRERVFDRFFRAADQSQSGSGLGLAIVKNVVDHLGGQIVLTERPDHEPGLCVKVWLPLHR
jgi:two-component system sensor histidine kinase QseC